MPGSISGLDGMETVHRPKDGELESWAENGQNLWKLKLASRALEYTRLAAWRLRPGEHGPRCRAEDVSRDAGGSSDFGTVRVWSWTINILSVSIANLSYVCERLRMLLPNDDYVRATSYKASACIAER